MNKREVYRLYRVTLGDQDTDCYNCVDVIARRAIDAITEAEKTLGGGDVNYYAVEVEIISSNIANLVGIINEKKR